MGEVLGVKPSVTAIVASHNRRDLTLACLRSFLELSGGFVLSAVLVDDGSSDGTAEAASAISSQVEVLHGDGSLFWARAMATAERRAMEGSPDFLLWLNDDVVLDSEALETLTATLDGAERRIVAGSIVDALSGAPTLGGADRVDWHPLRFRHVSPTDGESRSVTTISGNVVLVPRAVYVDVGGIDGGFAHALADWDYGLRARKLGIELFVTGRPVGICQPSTYEPWQHPSLTLRDKWRLRFGRKGGRSPASLARYLRRHGGVLWPIFWVAPFLRFAAHIVLSATQRHHSLESSVGGTLVPDGCDRQDPRLYGSTNLTLDGSDVPPSDYEERG
jgi:GT2 family glycosyltransferase